MAQGLGGSYGTQTQYDVGRQVGREALPLAVASRLHYQQSKTAQDVLAMSDEEWTPLSRDGLIDRDQVADYLRAYEHYSPTRT